MRSTLLALGVLVGFGTVSNAAPINVPVPTNAYIVQNGLDWAWASPLPAFIGDLSNPPNNGLDLSFQSQFGWGIPTFAQLVMALLATAFLFPDGNVPFGVFFSGGTAGVDPVSGAYFSARNPAYIAAASAGACATPYFSSVFLYAIRTRRLRQPAIAEQSRFMSTRPSTTLADLLTPLLVANPFSAVRASLRW